WGVYKDIYCAGNDDTFKFLEDVLSEVIDLFPGPYIHIGGDEAPKDRWKVCPKCQQRIKDEGLADEHELQSYFVKRIEKFVNSKGKRIIGWDEILEGGLAPEATVQSWQGTKGAIDAAKMGHDVIVSPTSHCYYDYPIETTDVPKVYSFDPVPPELNAEEIKHVLGTEGNMWTEYAPQNVIDHRLFPRIVALSEGGWTKLKHKNYADFNKRLQNHYDKLDELDVNYAFEVSSVKTNLVFNKDKNEFVISLENQQPQFDLYYTIDGAEPTISSTKYSEPIKLNKSATLKMALYRGDKKVGYTIEKDYTISKSQNKKVELTYPYSAVIPLLTGPIKLIWGLKSQSIFGVQLYERFTGGGDFALTDGVRGTSSYRDGLWQVFGQTDFEAVVDLEKATDINKIIIGFFTASSSLVVFPEYVEFFTSDDKENYRSLGKISKDFSLKDPSWIKKDFSLGVDNVSARYVKIFAKNPLTVPDWHPAAGRRVWLMVDEIIIE
ncbi:MAG: family 20 glycosylhydrolase, partial [Ignavibacteriaceae bacterium]|nr:family 20 glycosylhydrolase [Ignavibacteriaceae bacterium]